MDTYWAAPPVTRTITAATVLTSVLVHLGPLSAIRVILYLPYLFKFPPELWRLFSSFWLTGPKLSLILDPYFLFTYASSLERSSPRFSRPGDFFIYLVFVEVVILILYGFVLGGMAFIGALILALVYTYSQDNPNTRTTFFFFTFPTIYLPFVMLALTTVVDSPMAAIRQATGLVAAHAYDFLTRIWPVFGGGRNWIQAVIPNSIYHWFGANEQQRRDFGRVYRDSATQSPVTRVGDDRRGGWSSSIRGGDWASRGHGRRLGGD